MAGRQSSNIRADVSAAAVDVVAIVAAFAYVDATNNIQ